MSEGAGNSGGAEETPQQKRLARILAAQKAREAKQAERERAKREEEEKKKESRLKDAMGTIPRPLENLNGGGKWRRSANGWAHVSNRATEPTTQAEPSKPVQSATKWTKTSMGWMQVHNSGRIQEYVETPSAETLPSAVYCEMNLASGLSDRSKPWFTLTMRIIAQIVRNYVKTRCELSRFIINDVKLAIQQTFAEPFSYLTMFEYSVCETLIQTGIDAFKAIETDRLRQSLAVRVEQDVLRSLSSSLDKLVTERRNYYVENSYADEEAGCALLELSDWDIICIMIHSDIQTVFSMACTCRRMNELLSSEGFWEYYFQQHKKALLSLRTFKDSAKYYMKGEMSDVRRPIHGGLYYNTEKHVFFWVTDSSVFFKEKYKKVDPENIIKILAEHRHFDSTYVRMTF